jgi:hypothetical protein
LGDFSCGRIKRGLEIVAADGGGPDSFIG